MPENEFPKLRPHPFRSPADAAPPHAVPPPAYAELCITSNFTFLTGASHPEEFAIQARALGYHALAITDTQTLAGVVRAHVAARDAGVRFVLGSRLRPLDMPGLSLFVYPTDMPSYRGLCRMLTAAKRRAPKGECHLRFDDVAAHAQGLLAIAMPEGVPGEPFAAALDRIRPLFDNDRLSLALRAGYGEDDADRIGRTADLGQRLGIPLVATNDVHHHTADRRMLQDVLTCIRHTCALSQAGFRLHANAERHLKPPEEMHRLFVAYPRAVQRTIEIADRTKGFSLDQLRYEYPDEVVPAGKTPQQHLIDLTWRGCAERYPNGPTDKVRKLIEYELKLIDELNYAPYFLTVNDLVRFARTGEEHPGDKPVEGWLGPILCQGRGAAANSAVCYCLGVTAVDPTRIDLLFERFVSKERNEPPDIDIDFEHERREEVIQYIYRKYGRERAALTAEVISYRRRSAVRDVGKALGLSLDLVDRLAKDIEWFDQGTLDPQRLRELGLNPDDPTLQWLARLLSDILGFPRHLSQHVGGFVITRTPLCELVPIENAAMPDRTVIEWDKDDVDAAGMLKVDVLGLGMLTAIRRCLDFVNDRREQALTIANIPPEEDETYAMIQKADTIGVFQIESRAQMSMLPRLRPKEFYDLVIEVAIVRPGPIQGDMVHPYLRRRNGEEPIPNNVHPAFKEVLGKTLGVPLFQEQCMALAVKAAGFTPGEADQLRRAMAAWKRKGDQIHRFGRQLIDGMIARGIAREFAERCFEQIKGFSEYGFPESHAASFALLVYASAWLKCHHPAEFCAALLNSQPMGFYAPAQLIRDAKEHGVEVRPVDVGRSGWNCSIESGALRLGMRLVNGVGEPEAAKIQTAVAQHGPFPTMLSLWRRSGAKALALRRLAAADAFGSMGLSRQQALWNARLLRDDELPLFDQAPDPVEAETSLPRIGPHRQVVLDYAATGLSLKAHPVSFARGTLRGLGAIPCDELQDPKRAPDGRRVIVAGLVLVRQRPGTAGGVTFITIEDETGIANLIIWRDTYQRYRRAAGSRLLIAHGRIQRESSVVHIMVEKLQGLDAELDGLTIGSRDFR